MTPREPTGRFLVCVPTWNEAENLPWLLPRIRAAVPEADVLVVDDGSPDGTGAIADGLAAEDPAIHVLHRQGKGGLGRAYLAGFRWGLARGYAGLVECDADGSHDPSHLPTLVALLRDHELVVGSREVPGGGALGWSRRRTLLSRAGNGYCRAVLGLPIRDLTGGFNGWRAELLERLDLDAVASAGFAFQIELKTRALAAGATWCEFPIIFRERRAGTSKLSADIVREGLTRPWGLRRIRRRAARRARA